MKWICLDCPWTGSEKELTNDGTGYICPECGGDVYDEYEDEPDPLDDENQTFRNVEVSALCAEWNL